MWLQEHHTDINIYDFASVVLERTERMQDSICMCSYKHYFHEPVTVSSTVIDFLCSAVVIVCGLLVNSRFRKKLQDEKKNKFPGRKGNVIEPIMRWYLIFSMVHWAFSCK